MTGWHEIAAAEPGLTARVESRFAAGTNKTIATLRRDGSPRISAIELGFADGEVRLGMMGGSVKLADVRRDPRVAVHAPTVELAENETTWAGDAKLAGRLVEIEPPVDNEEPGAGFFRLDVAEVVLTWLGTPADHLVIESWHAGRGLTRRTH